MEQLSKKLTEYLNREVRVYLTNKVMLEGVLTSFDEFGIVLDDRTVVFRDNIISIVPEDEKSNEEEGKEESSE